MNFCGSWSARAKPGAGEGEREDRDRRDQETHASSGAERVTAVGLRVPQFRGETASGGVRRTVRPPGSAGGAQNRYDIASDTTTNV